MRITLVFLHTLIIIFAAVDLHYHFGHINKATNPQQRISAILHYLTDLVTITFYHTVSILIVWFNRHYSAGMIRASGILLIGELLETNTSIIKLTLEASHVHIGDICFITIHDFLLLAAVLITFRLAEKRSQHQKNLMQVELLANTVQDIPLDNMVDSSII